MSEMEKSLPKGWEVKRLGEVCIVQRGSSPRPIKKYITDDEGGVNWIKIGDVKKNDRYVTKTRQKITKEGAEKSRFVNKGDFILSNSMSYGRPYIMKISGYIHDGWFVLRLPKNLNSNYFWYLLSSPLVKEQFTSLAAGSVVKNIKGELVKKAKLPIPPLKEQQKIVTLLDEAFAQIDRAKANIEQNIVNAKELFQSKLNEIFSQRGDGWEEKELGKLCEKTKNIKWSEHQGKVYQYVDLSAVSRETLKITETKLVNNENAPSRAKKIIFEKDVIFATTRPTLKRATIITKKYDNNICSTGFVVLRPKEELILSEWIFFFLQTSYFMDRMESLQRGASYPAVTDTDVKKSIIGFPSLAIQKEIIEQLLNLAMSKNNLLNLYQQKLTNLEELKKSLLEKAFSGALTRDSMTAS